MGANVVDVYITYLRRKLAAVVPVMEAGDSVIETVRGLGYRMRSSRTTEIPLLPFAGQPLAKGA